MKEITYINRLTKQREQEKTPYASSLKFLYGNHPFAPLLRQICCKWPLMSKWFGKKQRESASQKFITPFIEKYNVDTSEFLEPVESFSSFNDFFIRKLKPSSRPITNGNDVAILPADGRYRVFQNIHHEEGFLVKGKKCSLQALLQDTQLAHK